MTILFSKVKSEHIVIGTFFMFFASYIVSANIALAILIIGALLKENWDRTTFQNLGFIEGIPYILKDASWYVLGALPIYLKGI